MANTIKLKQGSGSNPSASDLVVGEVALRTDGNPKLFTKNDAGNVLEVGLDSLNAKLPLTGGTLTGNLTISSNKPTIVLTEGDANPDYQIFSQGGAFKIKDSTNAADRLVVNTDGHVDIAGNLDVGSGIDVTGASTFEATTFTGNVTLTSVTPQLYFTDTNHNPDYAIWNHNGVLRFLDITNSSATRLEIQASGLVKASNGLQVAGNISTNGTINSGNIGVAGTAPTISLTDTNANDDFEIKVDGGLFEINDTTNNANRFKINSAGVVIIAGTCTATTFSGSGSSLTNIPAHQLTGTLPALDGSNLTGLTVNNANTLDNLDSTQFLRSDTNTLLNGIFTVGGSSVSGNEGGEIRFTHSPNSPLGGNEIVVDVVNSNFRIFEGGGNTRGFYLDLTSASNSAAGKIFHNGNDGSGSGLDSDTVDGIQASSFLRSDAVDSSSENITINTLEAGQWVLASSFAGLFHTNQSGQEYMIISNQTHTYVSASSGYNVYIRNGGNDATNQLIVGSGATGLSWRGATVWTASNDGSGSGLDSDTLDGLQTSATGNRWGVIPFVHTDGVMEVGRYIDFHNSDGDTSDHLVRFESVDSNTIHISGNKIFHAGNDGAGSTLDADTVDGIQASNFLRSDVSDTTSGNITFGNDGTGIFLSGGGFFKKIGTGLIVRLPSGGQQLQCENNSGTVIGTYFHSGIDGSGSGLDADTVDGLQASGFVRSDTSDTMNGELQMSASQDRQIVLNRNIASPSNYYNALQMEVRATTGTAGISLHRAGYSHVGMYTNAQDVLKYDFNSGTVTLNHNTGSVFGSGNDGSGSGLDSDLLDGQQGSYYTNAGNLSSGTIPAARIGSASTAELGISATGNFGQWQPHGQYTDFNSEPAYWGWNYIMGNTNAPNTTSNQWYRGRFSLGDAYGKGSDAGDYSMEITVPRSSPFSAGSMYVRTIENGNEGSWAEVGTRPYNSILPIQTSVALGNTTSRFANVYSQELNITKASGNLSAIIQADSGLGTIEVGGSTGAFIDLKHPATDDFDLRLGATGSVGYAASAGNYYISANNKNVLYATADNTTEIFYNGSHRLSTRDAGIDLHKAGEFFLKLTNTSNGQSDGTYVSSLIGMGKDDANNYTEYSKMITQIVDASNGTEDGRLIIQSKKDGTMTTAATVEAGYFQRNNAPGVSGDNFNWTNSLKYMHSGGLRFNTGDWNNSTGTFTCPVAGHYLCMATVQGHRTKDETGASDQYFNVLWQKNNINQFSESVATQHPDGQNTNNTTATHYTVSQCVIIQCSVGDTLRAYSNHGYRRAVQNQLSIMLLA